MTRVRAPRPLTASLIAGLLTGAIDSLLTLAVNLDPASTAYRVGYALGPLLLALAWAIPVGFVAGMIGSAAAAAGAVAAVWALSMGLDAWHSGQGWAALGILGSGIAISAVALARLALDIAGAIDRMLPLRRRILSLAAAVSGCTLVAAITPSSVTAFRAGNGPCAGTEVRADGPNLLLISVDALRADAAREMQSYQRLAARGIEFTQHFAASPWTLPSIASLMTGRQPHEHRAGMSLSTRSLLAKSPLDEHLPTLAGVLGQHGYRTHAIVTNPFLTARYGIDSGFCSYENVSMAGEAVRGLEHTTLLRFVRLLAPWALPSDRASAVRARAEDWLDARPTGPFFLWLHFLDPHAPYGDRDGESTSLTLDLMAMEDASDFQIPFRSIGRLRAGEYRPDADERGRIAGLYREDVLFVDRQIGRLLDFLSERGLADQTAIVLTADHGEEFWEHGSVEHGRTLYDEVLHIPLVVVPAGGSGPVIRTDMTSVTDVAATILALANIDDSALSGTGLLTTTAVSERPLLLGNLLFGEEWTGVRTARFKYMRSEDGEERLFDVVGDPGERVNVVASTPNALAALRALVR